jgi:hypothetical protein
MKLLRCKVCRGEVEIVGNERAINKKIKCTQCGFNNLETSEKKEPEVVIIRKRPAL